MVSMACCSLVAVVGSGVLATAYMASQQAQPEESNKISDVLDSIKRKSFVEQTALLRQAYPGLPLKEGKSGANNVLFYTLDSSRKTITALNLNGHGAAM